jgi:hypothetical protein
VGALPVGAGRAAMTGFWWGVLSTLGASLLLALTQRDTREDLIGAAAALLAIPMLLVLGAATGLGKLVYKPRRLSPEALARIAQTARARGVLISRRHRAVLVITDPKRKRRVGGGG